ncbi:helix-turn-helix transcriptional regulator [Flexivirga sp. ID2601S]|uniref:Helix-turn-helix transcriptional regulator n=1 Tax=Flexivirga aerilata TaxID=1656889 RepID=A0A849AFZ9_9MICO|nr:helix-turn-helix domain-containing protein [Flexivirga aerilata]NNG38793.1 helix-turn-helix transcriptional regulator [Flexivirga aerilata]
MRMLAHEVRQDLLDHLSGGRVLTATEAARLSGITPSAMSYHLRAMQRWGVVERVDSHDGRERPWRMAADRITIQDAAWSGTAGSVAGSLLDGFVRRLAATIQQLVDRDDPNEHATISQVRGAWLTDEEAEQLDQVVADAIHRFEERRRGGPRPDAATERDIYWLSIPHPGAGDEPARE